MKKIDIHVHTTTSSCSIFRPDELIELAVEKSVPVVVITNHHDSTGDVKYLRSRLKSNGIELFAGLEMTNEWGDFLVFGEELSDFQGYSKKFPKSMLPREDIAIVWAHPYRFYSPYEIDRIKHKAAHYIDAVEGINGNCIRSCPYANNLAIKLAKELNKPLVAGSDAHSANMFFMTYTLFEDTVESYRDFIYAIKQGKVEMKNR